MQGDKEDRISSLPDCLLVDIISRLPTTKHAIRTTSTLSKRWQHLWTLLPNLVFIASEVFTNFESFSTDLSRYFTFIDKTLTKCRTTHSDLNMFKFHMCYNSPINFRIKAQVINWIRYAISRNVRELDLRLWEGELIHFIYDDVLFFNNSCFTCVKVTRCVFSPPLDGVISWSKLKYLYISHGKLDDDMIRKISSGSPCLETLELNECDGYKQIDITSKSVKKLVFSGYNILFMLACEDSIEINAPYISSLTIQGKMNLREILLLNVSSLVNVKLDITKYEIFAWSQEDVEENLLRVLLNSLGHVSNITFGDYCSELLSDLEDEDDTSSGSDSEDERFHTSRLFRTWY